MKYLQLYELFKKKPKFKKNWSTGELYNAKGNYLTKQEQPEDSEFYKYNTIKLNKEEAEELLRSIKNDFAMNLTKKDAENYNL